jgi:hypothetical protein
MTPDTCPKLKADEFNRIVAEFLGHRSCLRIYEFGEWSRYRNQRPEWPTEAIQGLHMRWALVDEMRRSIPKRYSMGVKAHS